MSLVEVNDLSVNFKVEGGTLEAVRAVSFQIEKGETVALVGESGSGKSVTAYALVGLLDPAARVTGGRIEYQGQDLLTAGALGMTLAFEPTEQDAMLRPPRRRVACGVSEAAASACHDTMLGAKAPGLRSHYTSRGKATLLTNGASLLPTI